MPKRTNIFQEVVAIIHSHLSGDNAVVTESKMLRDLVSGDEREVDTCIEFDQAGHRVTISVECRAHGRPQPIGWIEEMHGKHLRLPTNVLVLASQSGFTKSALEKAKSLGIETVTPGKVSDAFGSHIVNKIKELWVKQFALTPERIRFWVEESHLDPEEVVVALPDTGIFFADGALLTDAQSVAYDLVRTINIDNEAMRDSVGDETRFEVGMKPACVPHPETGQPADVYLQKEGPSGSYLRRISQISVTGAAKVTVASMPLKYGELLGAGYAHGIAELEDGKMLFVATETMGGHRRTSLRVTTADK